MPEVFTACLGVVGYRIRGGLMTAAYLIPLAACLLSTVYWLICRRRARRWAQLRPRDWKKGDKQ